MIGKSLHWFVKKGNSIRTLWEYSFTIPETPFAIVVRVSPKRHHPKHFEQHSLLRLMLVSLLALTLIGCATSAISPETRNLELPEQWAQGADLNRREVATDNWLKTLNSRELDILIPEALANNYQLARQRAILEELRQSITSEGAARWPSLSLGIEGARNTVDDEDGNSLASNSWRAGFDLAWEIDLWNKLSDSQRQAELRFQSAAATLRAQQLQLAADVASNWFNVLANKNLESLLARRLENVSSDLSVLEQSYRLGIGAALNVYLGRNTVADSRVALAQQRQNLQAATAQLQSLLARYPSGAGLELSAALPELEPFNAAGTPAQMLQRRPDIQQAWLDLLAADAGLAVAHKNRFPAFSLAGRAGYSADGLRDLVSSGMSSWSVGASLLQPLFTAGRLKSLEAQARARVAQAELVYLDTVYVALAESETLLSAEATLRQQLQAQRESLQNADIAYELSLQQYERGLVDYTTVLEAQRRAFDAQTSVIQLHNGIIANRISLYRALGGDFAHTEVKKLKPHDNN